MKTTKRKDSVLKASVLTYKGVVWQSVKLAIVHAPTVMEIAIRVANNKEDIVLATTTVAKKADTKTVVVTRTDKTTTTIVVAIAHTTI